MPSFTGIFHQAEGGWVAWAEELPGANTQGDTMDEARENLQEAIQLILETNRARTQERLGTREFVRESILVG